MSKFLNAKIPYNFLHKKIIAHAGKNSGLFSVGSSGSLEPLNFTNVSILQMFWKLSIS